MQRDKLEQYETETSVLPRKTIRSLAKLPRVQRRWPKRLFAITVLGIVVAGLWLVLA